MDRDVDAEIAGASRHPDDARVKRCAACAAHVDPLRRLPAAVLPGDSATVYLFCGEVCRREWLNERTGAVDSSNET